MGHLVIPAKLAATSVAWTGAPAREWLARLPQLVDEVTDRWDLEVGAPLEPGGNISWVAPARRRSDDLDAILKIQLPHPESDPEAAALAAWDGDGAVRLYDHDPDRCALLIEACRPGRGLGDEGGTADAVRAGAAVLERLRQAAPPVGLPRLEDLLDSWADEVEERHDPAAGPDPGLVRRAVDTMRTRPRSCTDAVLLHGDLNPSNILSAEREPWLAIDPKPMVGDPAFDGRRLVCQPDPRATDDPAATLASRLQLVAAAIEVDELALREWCLVDAVEIGTFARARSDLAVAEQCDDLAALLAPLLPVIGELIERSADPVRVRAAIDGLPHPAGDVEAVAVALVPVLAASRSLARVLATDPGALAVLREDAPRLDPPESGLDDVITWKRRELLRIAGRDLTGTDDLSTTTAALAEMAADVLRVVVDTADDVLAPGDRVAVVGMGKLGGTELNYASDVDLLLVGEGDPERLERAGRAVLDRAGRAFRVDADLRPEGRDGPLVRTVASYEAYWERWAAPWERQALLKARPVAGDAELGAAWQERASAALWGEPFTADDLRYVRALKVRSEQEVGRRGDRDVKRGPGGIRDVEFAVQLLQLVHGPVDDELRARGTLATLGDLHRGGYIDPADGEVLASSYEFLRRVEHALQLEDERQVHSVPADRSRRRHVARVLGFRGTPEAGPTEAFDQALAEHRSRVRRAHERVWFRPLLESLSGAGPLGETATAERLAAFGFADVERTRQAVAELTRGLTRSSRMMQQLLPLLLDWLSAAPDPDLGLLGLRRLASGEDRSRALATMFRDSPEAARLLALLLGTSRQLGDVLLANPDLIERLPDPSRLRTLERDALVASAHRVIDWREGRDDQQRALQRWKQRHLLGIAARDVFGHASVAQVGTDLTRLAEATLEGALQRLDPQLPVAVIAFGRLGGGELGYASDLDIAFVHDGANTEEAERVAAGVLRFVGGDTPAERIWAVDADLRPEGRSGPLGRSLDGWVGYLARWVSTWERQAYLRARPVAGDPDLGRALVDRLRGAVVEQPLTATDEREVRRMKVRIEQERIGPGDDPEFHLKLGRGSLSDIEFTVQLLQLRHRIDQPSTMGALGALVEGGHLPSEEAEVLEEAYRSCERTRNRTFLVVGSGDALPARPELITPVARSLGFTVPELREEYRHVTRRARRVVERRFYDRG